MHFALSHTFLLAQLTQNERPRGEMTNGLNFRRYMYVTLPVLPECQTQNTAFEDVVSIRLHSKRDPNALCGRSAREDSFGIEDNVTRMPQHRQVLSRPTTFTVKTATPTTGRDVLGQQLFRLIAGSYTVFSTIFQQAKSQHPPDFEMPLWWYNVSKYRTSGCAICFLTM